MSLLKHVLDLKYFAIHSPPYRVENGFFVAIAFCPACELGYRENSKIASFGDKVCNIDGDLGSYLASKCRSRWAFL